MIAWLYYCGITGSVFAVLAMLLRALFKGVFPRRAIVLLLTLAVVLLLTPLRLSSPVSIYNVVPAVPRDVLRLTDATRDVPDPEEAEKFETVASETVLPTGARLWRAFTVVWLTGSLLLAALLGIAYIASFRRFGDAVPIEGARAFWGAWCRVRVHRSDKTPSPVVVGALFPKIVLPSSLDFQDAKFLDYIIEHELMHIRRFDNVLKFASALTVCLYWFNPVVWLLHRAICKDIEFSCDEAVLASFGPEKKNSYVRIMVDAAERFFTENLPLKGREVFVMFGENNVKERIENVLRFKNVTAGTFVLAAVLLTGVSAVFATDAAGPGGAFSAVQSDPGGRVDSGRAEKIAFDRAGGGVLVKLEYKVDKRGAAKYDVEIQQDELRHKLDIDAETGDVLKYERKIPKTAAQSLGPVAVSPERARAMALEYAGGGTVVAYKLDRERNGRVKYDVDVVSGGIKYDFKIDAATGEIYKVKRDPVRK